MVDGEGGGIEGRNLVTSLGQEQGILAHSAAHIQDAARREFGQGLENLLVPDVLHR
jgi:hypothetical protein